MDECDAVEFVQARVVTRLRMEARVNREDDAFKAITHEALEAVHRARKGVLAQANTFR